jgi:beta-glucanase (GH16 family)
VDEFDGSSLKAAWGNTSHWTDLSEAVADRSMLSVGNGLLAIKAQRINGTWHAGELDTWSRFEQRFGFFEARMKFTGGKGLWPAFWLANDWTGDRSELDINETLANPFSGSCGDNSGGYYATVHLADGSTPDGSRRFCSGSDMAGEWHTYGMDWRSDHVTFFVDGVAWYTYRGTVPTSDMPLIFNLAVGGWAGASNSTTPSPSYLYVDWVRVRA